MLQAGRSRIRFSMRPLDFFNLPNSSSHSMAMELTHPLTEMNTRNIAFGGGGGGKGQPEREAENFTAICDPTVEKIWEPQRLTTFYGPSRPVTGIALPFLISL
jgi:hypothetical protein